MHVRALYIDTLKKYRQKYVLFSQRTHPLETPYNKSTAEQCNDGPNEKDDKAN